ncbi:MAG: pantetheine-phosphate adenylyltransferase [Bacteroidota bacterium]
MKKTAVFPGSFDPFTIGHESVVLRALPLFDQIIVAIGYNSAKNSGYFSIDERITFINTVFAQHPKVSVQAYEGLTVDYCKSIEASYILRGLRTAADFEYERAIAQINNAMSPQIETFFMLTKPEHSAISSSIVREILRHKGDVRQFIPQSIRETLPEK